MNEKDVAIIFDDLTEYFVMRPAIDDMVKNKISVDIIVPKDSGYDNLAAHTKKKIKEDGYKVMDNCDKKTQYKKDPPPVLFRWMGVITFVHLCDLLEN